MNNKSDQKIEDLLFELYYSPSKSPAFSNCKTLHTYIKNHTKQDVSKQLIQKWLSKQPTYTLHKERITKFQRCSYNICNIDDLWEIDLIDVQSISRKNRGFKYILAVIDCFSKYAWCLPIKRKTPKEIIDAFNTLFSSTTRRPLVIQSDKGREFNNAAVKKYLTQHEISYNTTRDPVTKAAICERFIRTIKAIIYKYFTYTKDTKYVDVLDLLLSVYNNRRHSAIGMSPVEVSETNVLKVWLYMQKRKKKSPRRRTYTVGDTVRVSNPKTVFEKGYKPKWSTEFFTIDKCIWKLPVVYRLRDSDGSLIKGNFYEQELQLVDIE